MTTRFTCLTLVFCMCFVSFSWGQSCYEKRLKTAQDARASKDYRTAIQVLTDKSCNRLSKTQKEVLQEYLNLVNQEYIQFLEQKVESSAKIADVVFFYDNKLALAAKEINGIIKYGYINKQGTVVIDFAYDEADLFDEDIGYAKVKKDKKYYYLDTTGREYLLAESVQEMTRETEVLDLSRQGLKKLPEKLKIYTHLKILNLYDNEFYQLPDWLSELKYLEEVYLGYNMFNEIPEPILKLQNLTYLDLYDNEITQVPEEIKDLKPLAFLSLSYNPIGILPDEISNLVYLKELHLEATPLSAKKEIRSVIQKRIPNCVIKWDK